jgi:hypothetical protein
MGIDFGDVVKKAEEALSEHPDQVKGGLEKVGEFVKGKVGHGEQVDAAIDKVEGMLGGKHADQQQQPQQDTNPQ